MSQRRRSGSGLSLDLAVMSAPVLALVTTVVTARYLGPAWRGAIAVLSTWCQLLGVVALMGLDRGLVAHARDAALGATTIRVLHRSLARQLALPLAVASLASAGIVMRSTHTLWVAGAALVLTVLLGVVEWRAALALALQDWRAYKLFRILQPAVYALGALMLGLAPVRWGQPGLARAVGVVLVLSYLAELLVLPRGLSSGGGSAVDVAAARRAGLEFWPSGAAMQAAARIGLYLAPLVMPLEQVGLFSAAQAPASALAAISGAVMVRSLTGASGDTFPLRHWLASAAAAAAATLTMPFLIPLVFGSEFADAVRASQVLMCMVLTQYVVAWGAGRMAGHGVRGSLVPQLATVVVATMGALTFGHTLERFALAVVGGGLCGAILTFVEVGRIRRAPANVNVL